ncbi:nuclear transport factor 2 family protein [Herbiconiux sp. YIM B11900]|uniref:nuclear transport factor 2 family protein n=1 Tax=Herbiconiux sp. YIM B11900 TaxID=3404131 RepID=UPI003F87B425
MSGTGTADAITRAEILDVERRRIRALIDGDIATLDELFDESIVHIHAPGLMHDKTQLLEHVAVRRAYRAIDRGDLTIRRFGDVAVVTGMIFNTLGSPDGTERKLSGPVTQVLRRGQGGWTYLSFQMTPSGEHIWEPTASEKASQSPATAPTGSPTEEQR